MKNLILVAVLLLTVSALSFAQSANITANVNATIVVTRLTDLAIGNLNQGQTVSIASASAAAASFSITGAANAATTVTVTFPGTLTSGVNTMSFTGNIPNYHATAGFGGSTAFGALTGGQTNTSGTGALWIYIGGGVTADPAQAVGSYTGTLSVAVTQP